MKISLCLPMIGLRMHEPCAHVQHSVLLASSDMKLVWSSWIQFLRDISETRQLYSYGHVSYTVHAKCCEDISKNVEYRNQNILSGLTFLHSILLANNT